LRAATVSLVAALTAAGPVLANPQNGTVVGGSVDLGSDGTATRTITQQSERAIINWQRFDIGNGEATRFVQPGSGAIVLNRVIGGEGRSTIDGALTANGGVWLINPNGVLFGANARVDVHSLLATTADILDGDFMNGASSRFAFATPSANADATIVNQGEITLGEAGLGALVAPHVRNEGVISGRLATVILAGTPTFTLDLTGDGLVQFDATSQVATAPEGADALVENTGAITAPGGTVMLSARAATNVIDEVINNGGVIEATGVSVHDGRIVLDGGDNDRVAVGGSLDVGPGEAGAAGGRIDVTGQYVEVVPKASLDASDGGTIALRAAKDLGVDAAIEQTGETSISLEGTTVVIRQPVATDGSVRITSKHARTEGQGTVAAEQLVLASNAISHHPDGGGHATLNTDVRQLSIGTATESNAHYNGVAIDNQGNLVVGIATEGLNVGSIVLTTTGALVLNQPIAASGAGDAIVLGTDQFLNQAGTDALQTPNGRWLVYSVDPQHDERGGLAAALLFATSFGGTPPAGIPATGNVFLYTQPPPAPPTPAPPVPSLTTPLDLEQALAIATIPINDEPLIEVTAPPAPSKTSVESPRLVSVAPTADDRDQDAPLFASDGNRDLWDLPVER
jgi:filamentous haemagglutinin family N-terminal domain